MKDKSNQQLLGALWHCKEGTLTSLSEGKINSDWFYQLLVDVWDGKYTDDNDYFVFKPNLIAGSGDNGNIPNGYGPRIKPSEIKAKLSKRPVTLESIEFGKGYWPNEYNVVIEEKQYTLDVSSTDSVGSIIAVYSDGSKKNITSDVVIKEGENTVNYNSLTFTRASSDIEKDERTLTISYKNVTKQHKIRVASISGELISYKLSEFPTTQPGVNETINFFDEIVFVDNDLKVYKTSVYVNVEGTIRCVEPKIKGALYHLQNGKSELISKGQTNTTWFYQLLIDVWDGKYTDANDYFVFSPNSMTTLQNIYGPIIKPSDMKAKLSNRPEVKLVSIGFATTTWPDKNNVVQSENTYVLNTESTTDVNSIVARYSNGTVKNITKEALIKEGNTTLNYNSLTFTRASADVEKDERILTISYNGLTINHKIRVLVYDELFSYKIATMPTYPEDFTYSDFRTYKLFEEIIFYKKEGSNKWVECVDFECAYYSDENSNRNLLRFCKLYHHKDGVTKEMKANTYPTSTPSEDATVTLYKFFSDIWFYQYMYPGNDYFTIDCNQDGIDNPEIGPRIKPSEIKAMMSVRPKTIWSIYFAKGYWPNEYNVAIESQKYTLDLDSIDNVNSIIAEYSDGSKRNITKYVKFTDRGAEDFNHPDNEEMYFQFTRESSDTPEDLRWLGINYMGETKSYQIRVASKSGELISYKLSEFPTTPPGVNETINFFDEVIYADDYYNVNKTSVYVDVDGTIRGVDPKFIGGLYHCNWKNGKSELISNSQTSTKWFYQFLIDICDFIYTDYDDYFVFFVFNPNYTTTGVNGFCPKIKPNQIYDKLSKRPESIT